MIAHRRSRGRYLFGYRLCILYTFQDAGLPSNRLMNEGRPWNVNGRRKERGAKKGEGGGRRRGSARASPDHFLGLVLCPSPFFAENRSYWRLRKSEIGVESRPCTNRLRATDRWRGGDFSAPALASRLSLYAGLRQFRARATNGRVRQTNFLPPASPYRVAGKIVR